MPGRPLPACRRLRPRWVRISARPLASRPPWPSGCTKPWAPRMSVISWLPLLRPTRLRTYASTTPLPRPPPGSLPVWVGSPLTGRVSHPLDDKQSFMMSSHHHSPLTSLAWSHHAPTPRPASTAAGAAGVCLGDQSPVPAENRVRRDDAGDLHQDAPSEFLAAHGESTALGIGQAKRPRAQVLPEDPILLPEIRDQIVLVAVHPASERENEEL